MGKWEMVRLGDVCQFINGDRGVNYPSKKDFIEAGVPFINAGHLNNKSIDFSEMNYISFEKYMQLGSGKVRNGDILYCLRGSLGKQAVVKDFDFGAIASSLVIIRPLSEVAVKYLSYCLESSKVLKQQLQANTGSSQPNLSATNVKNYSIPLPPLDEQKRIAQNLDLASEIVKGYKDQLAELDKLVQSVFYEMFNGIKQTVKLSHYIKTLTAGKSLAGKAPCINKVLKTGAVSYDYFDKNAVKYLPLEYNPIKDNLVREGTVIISRMNTIELVGAAAYVWDVDANTYLPDRLWRAELFEESANPIFVWQMLIQESTKRKIRRVASGTSGSMKNISKPNLLSITVMDVSLPLQTRFASIVTEIEAQRAQIQQALTEAENLFNSLMQEYFE